MGEDVWEVQFPVGGLGGDEGEESFGGEGKAWIGEVMGWGRVRNRLR